MTLANRIASRFPIKARTEVPLIFAGGDMQRDGQSLSIKHPDYCSTLSTISTDAGFDVFKKILHQLVWLPLTRPDILAAVNLLAQVKYE